MSPVEHRQNNGVGARVRTVKLALLSDLHVGAGPDEVVVDALRDVVDTINDDVDPDFVAVLGDLIHHGADASVDEERLAMVQRELAELDAPYRAVPGNHDLVNLDAGTLETHLGTPLWGIDEERNLVFLNSARAEFATARGVLGEKQIEALTAALDRLDDALVLVHHPVHYRDLRDNYWFSDVPEQAFCGDKSVLLNRIDDGPDGSIRAVCNGHLHDGALTRYRGLPHVSVDPFNSEREPHGETGGYAVVTRGEKLTIERRAGDGTETTVRLP